LTIAFVTRIATVALFYGMVQD